jgi:hypothetical protein
MKLLLSLLLSATIARAAYYPPPTTQAVSSVNGLTGAIVLSLTNIQGLNNVYVDASNYTTIAAAITYAESLSAANSSPGVGIIVPAGQFTENVTIHKNVSLYGAGISNTYITSVTIRPTSNSVAPQTITISDLSINNAANTGFLTVDNQTTSNSGIYNLSMLSTSGYTALGGLTLNNVGVGTIIANNITNLNLFNVQCSAPTVTLLNVNIVEITGGFINSTVAINGNDAGTGAAGTSTTVYIDTGVMIGAIAVTKVGGTNNPRFVATNSELAAITIGANTDVEVTGGTNGGKSGSAATVWNSTSPYTPATAGNWPTVPASIDAALDNLALTRVKWDANHAVAYTLGSASSVGLAITEASSATGDAIQVFDSGPSKRWFVQANGSMTTLGDTRLQGNTNLGQVVSMNPGDTYQITVTDNGSPHAAGAFGVKPQNDATMGFGIRGNSATQSANLQQWEKSDGTVLGAVGPNGGFQVATIAARPTCASGIRGMMWVVRAGATQDKLEICVLESDGTTYDWASVGLTLL